MPRNSRETASYNAAIKAVTDAMQGSESEEVHALKGLWRVFDAGVGELGAELNDSLSNKAIFEGENIMCYVSAVRYESHWLQCILVPQLVSTKKHRNGKANPYPNRRKTLTQPTDAKYTNPTSVLPFSAFEAPSLMCS